MEEIFKMIIDTMIKIFPTVDKLQLENLIKTLSGGIIILIIILIIKYHKQILEFIILLKDMVLSVKDHF